MYITAGIVNPAIHIVIDLYSFLFSSVHSFFFLLRDHLIENLVYFHCEILSVMVLVVEKLPADLFLASYLSLCLLVISNVNNVL